MARFTIAAGQHWMGYAAALAAVAMVTGIIVLVEQRWQPANISMLYLIGVLATATAFGRGPAVLAAVAAFVTFDWLFVEPVHTLVVADPAEWVALLLFLVTAVVTGQLAASQRRRAREARQREREAMVLYDVARLLGESDLGRALQALAERLRHELLLAGVLIEVADRELVTARAAAGEPAALQLARSSGPVTKDMLGEGPLPTANQHGEPGRWVRIVPPRVPGAERTLKGHRLHVVPVKARGRRVGDLLLVHPPGVPQPTAADSRLLSAVAAHLGAAVERLSLQRGATEAEILRRTDELKSALLNAVSHDLRTPLASIIASAGSLRQTEVTWEEEDRRDFAQAIELEARRLDRLVGNLLDLSRIEGGSLRPVKDWHDLAGLVDDVLGRLRPLTAQHALTVDIPEDLVPVPLDYVQIDQVLSNLIENAIKYTTPGAEIRISARAADAQVRVEVADRGPGIPAPALPHLFDPFYRANGWDRQPKGTGLGLAVARGLVEAHRGRIWAENRPDGGARFVFTLPLAPSEQASAATKQGAP